MSYRRMIRIVCFLVADLLVSGSVEAAPFAFSVKSPSSVRVGSAFTVDVELTVDNIPPDPGVRGWDLVLAADGPCEIIDATMIGTDVESHRTQW